MTDQFNDRYLIIKAKGGFGNRMLSASTGIALAALTDRIPLIDWRDGEYAAKGTNVYPLLFDSPAKIEVSALDHRADVAPDLWKGRLSQHPTDVIHELYPNSHSDPFIYRKLSIPLNHPDVPEPLAVFWSYLPKMARLRRQLRQHPAFRRMNVDQVTRWALDRHFRPNQRVVNEVRRIFNGCSHPMIGVHIRYTDRKVPLEPLLHEVHLLRKRVPAAGLFLATDNHAVQNRVRETHPDVVVISKALGDDAHSIHEHLRHDDPLREAENALIDMWALAHCHWLIHSRHSTFSVAAALIGGIPRGRQIDVDRHNPRVVLKRWVQTIA